MQRLSDDQCRTVGVPWSCLRLVSRASYYTPGTGTAHSTNQLSEHFARAHARANQSEQVSSASAKTLAVQRVHSPRAIAMSQLSLHRRRCHSLGARAQKHHDGSLKFLRRWSIPGARDAKRWSPALAPLSSGAAQPWLTRFEHIHRKLRGRLLITPDAEHTSSTAQK